MSDRGTLLEEFFVKGLKSPVTQQMLLDFCLTVLPLLLIGFF